MFTTPACKQKYNEFWPYYLADAYNNVLRTHICVLRTYHVEKNKTSYLWSCSVVCCWHSMWFVV